MKTFVTSLACALLILLLVTGCNRETSGSVPAVPTLVVGAVLSQTGPAAAYGSEADKGARLAVEQLNARPGAFKIEYIPMDDKSDRTEAVKVARMLIDADKVNVILGPAISPSALSVGKLAEERQIPIVGTSPTQDEVTASSEYDRKYVSRVCFNDSFQGGVLARFVHDSLGKRTAAIVYDKTLSYSIGLSKTFKEEFTRLGGEVKHEENYSVRDTDYSPLIDKVATYDVDVLFIPGWDENVGPMLKQAGHRWDKFVLIGGDAWPTNRLLELSGGNIRSAYALSHYVPDDPDPKVQEFQAAYRAKYNETSSPFSALGYDAVMLIADAAQRAKSLSGPDLKDAISRTQGLRLVTGTITFDEHRNPVKDAVIVRIEPNRIVYQERIRPVA
jgi:branched-chain amino acid transport system substrate-binding protein